MLIHFGVSVLVCTSIKISIHDAYRSKTFPELQCIILQNVTSFRPIISSLTYQIHLVGPCTFARFIHDVPRSETIPSTPIYHPTKFNVITSNILAVLCLQFHFGVCARVHYSCTMCMCLDRKTFPVLQYIILQNLT